MKPVSVFNYRDYRLFLKDYFTAKKQEKPGFSHRYFCTLAGFSSSGVIKLVIDNKRNLSRTSLIKISRAVGFTEKEHEYFEALVLYNQAKKNDERREYRHRLSALRGLSDPSLIDHKHHDIYRDWYITVVREYLGMDGVSTLPKDIARRIWPCISSEKVTKAIMILEESGLILKQDDGSYRLCDQSITTEDELTSESVAYFNREMIRHALAASHIFPKQKREISGVTLRISKERFKEIKKRVAAFKKELLYLAMNDEKADRIYQVNFQIFPLVTDD